MKGSNGVMLTFVLIATGLIEMSAASSSSSSRCKKDVNTIFPHGVCGTFNDCYNCNEAEGCGWCGGSGCGRTKPGCYNKSERVLGSARRHGDDKDSPLCSSPEGDMWLDDASKCTFCEQFQSCDLCIDALLPAWDRKDARCIWCEESRSCRRGSVAEGPFYRFDTCSKFRWDRGFGECAAYVNCKEQSSCFLCASSYSALNSRCHWCPNASIPWINNEEGGGQCVASSSNLTCQTAIHDPISCPRQPKLGPQPPSSSSPSNLHLERINTVLGAGILLIAVMPFLPPCLLFFNCVSL